MVSQVFCFKEEKSAVKILMCIAKKSIYLSIYIKYIYIHIHVSMSSLRNTKKSV